MDRKKGGTPDNNAKRGKKDRGKAVAGGPRRTRRGKPPKGVMNRAGREKRGEQQLKKRARVFTLGGGRPITNGGGGDANRRRQERAT